MLEIRCARDHLLACICVTITSCRSRSPCPSPPIRAQTQPSAALRTPSSRMPSTPSRLAHPPFRSFSPCPREHRTTSARPRHRGSCNIGCTVPLRLPCWPLATTSPSRVMAQHIGGVTALHVDPTTHKRSALTTHLERLKIFLRNVSNTSHGTSVTLRLSAMISSKAACSYFW